MIYRECDESTVDTTTIMTIPEKIGDERGGNQNKVGQEGGKERGY